MNLFIKCKVMSKVMDEAMDEVMDAIASVSFVSLLNRFTSVLAAWAGRNRRKFFEFEIREKDPEIASRIPRTKEVNGSRVL